MSRQSLGVLYIFGDFQNNKKISFSDDLKGVFGYCLTCQFYRKTVHWIPAKNFTVCKTMLDRWQKDKKKVKFVEPTVWREPNSKEDCYFWMTNTKGFKTTNSHKIQLVYVFSVTKESKKFDNDNK